MTTADFEAKVVLVSETEGTDPSGLVQVDSRLSFHLSLDAKTRLLSSGDFDDGDSLKGLVYVPTLDREDPCVNSTASIVPQNVTRVDDFPRSGYDLIALAPWTSPNCTLSYLDVAKSDKARAFIFYRPGSADRLPPPVSDSMWNLSDSGVWKTDVRYPVYAIPSSVGGDLIMQTAEYSGNLTEVENGSELSRKYGSDNYPRLSISITSDDHNATLPNLWIFLIGVLAVLLTFVISSSIAMRWIQRRRRQALARRLAAGEVDLESIGIKKLKVPRSMLDKMPLYIYTESSTPPIGEKPSNTTAECNGCEPRPASSERIRAQYGTLDTSAKGVGTQISGTTPLEGEHTCPRKQRASLPENNLLFSQSTCSICLSDYVPLSTNVRELPCGHIFHPECIDTFLVQTSSLCPVCKKCSLPPGYCPEQVTNAMVYRERTSRNRARSVRAPGPLPMPIPTRGEVHRTRNGYSRPIRSTASRTTSENSTQENDHQSLFGRLKFWGRSTAQTDMSQADDNAPHNQSASSDAAQCPDDDTTHEERMRRRAAAMLGPHHTAEDHDREEESISRWRRIVNKYFPGFR